MPIRPDLPACTLRVLDNPGYIDVSVLADACRDLRETLGAGTRRYQQAYRRLRERAKREVDVHLRRVATIRLVAIHPRPIAPQTPLPVREHGQ